MAGRSRHAPIVVPVVSGRETAASHSSGLSCIAHPVTYFIFGLFVGALASVSFEQLTSHRPVPISAIVARAAAELRCECPPAPPCPVASQNTDSGPHARGVASSGAEGAWWAETAGKYGIVVVEPRLHPTLIFMITDTLAKIPPTWKALVFYSPKNEKFLRLALQPWILTKRVMMAPFPPGHDDSYMFSNDMLLRPEFYQSVPFSKFLIMHTDGLICFKDWDKLSTFVEFDYIGSPWRDLKVGNGGFSWRNRDLSLKIVKETKPPLRDFPEDWYMAKQTEKYGGTVAPWEVAKHFGMETVWFEEPYGLHAAWHYHKNWTQLKCDGIELMGTLHLAAGGVQIPGNLC